MRRAVVVAAEGRAKGKRTATATHTISAAHSKQTGSAQMMLRAALLG
jgi:hypothetical protein